MADDPKQRWTLGRNIVDALRLAWSASPRRVVTVGLLTSIPAILPAVNVWLGKQLVDQVAEGFTRVAAGGPPVSTRSLLPTVGALAASAAVLTLTGVFAETQQLLLGLRVNVVANRRFLAKAAEVDLGNYDNPEWHDRHQRASIGLNFRPLQLTSQTLSLGAAFLTGLSMLGLLASLHPILVVLAVVAVVPGLLAQRRANRAIYEHHFEWTAHDRERQYVKNLVSTPEVALEVRAFGSGQYFLDRFEQLSEDDYRRQVRIYGNANRAYGIGGVVSAAILALAYAFVADRSAGGQLTPGAITALIGALASVTTQVNGISSAVANIEQHATFLKDYFDFLSLPRLVPRSPSPTPLPERLDDGIRFEGVRFRYPTGESYALDGLDLHIRQGEMLALVGDNGSGKTSMVKLLERFYDPTEGRVLVGGVDLRDASITELRERIGVLFQDFVKYQLSARENVAFGRVERPIEDAVVWRALERARADGVVKDLAEGLDNKVGRLFEGGHDLSGGQWQRLALARLMYRDADVWILDEPTSALDPEAEAAIFAELREHLEGRIGIVISHRFSTVRIADRIAVIEAGRVTELGSHDELIELGGRYAELFELQAAAYR